MELRIKKELDDIEKNPIEGCHASLLKPDDLYHWKADISGHPNSPYEGGVFILKIDLPKEYPLKPPICRFVTKIFHPNVNDKGGICLDFLNREWSPVLSIGKLLLSITSFLTEPNTDHSLRPELALLYNTNREQYNLTAKQWTEKYAMIHIKKNNDNKDNEKKNDENLSNNNIIQNNDKMNNKIMGSNDDNK